MLQVGRCVYPGPSKRIPSLWGDPRSVHRKWPSSSASILYDPEVQVLLAIDAAGEGINLLRAHLMVNYDLPWNEK